MTVFDARIQDGKLVLSPEQAAELGLRKGDAMPVTIQAQEENPFVRWIGTLPSPCRKVRTRRSFIAVCEMQSDARSHGAGRQYY